MDAKNKLLYLLFTDGEQLSGGREKDLATEFNLGLAHPLHYLIEPTSDISHLVLNNTIQGLSTALLPQYSKWYENNRKKIVSANHENSCGALAEIRALGFLYLSMKKYAKAIEPSLTIGTSAPDFCISIDCGNNGEEEILVEVTTKNIVDSAKKGLQNYLSDRDIDPNKNRGSYSAFSFAPLGNESKRNDSWNGISDTTESAIRHIRRKFNRRKENQADESKFTILWFDMQDKHFIGLVNSRNAFPIRSWGEAIHSGELWYACYAKENLMVLQGDHHSEDTALSIGVEGVFSKAGSMFDGVVFSLADANIFFENPYSQKTLSDSSRRFINGLPNFRLEYSWMRWPLDDLLTRIENEHSRINKLAIERKLH